MNLWHSLFKPSEWGGVRSTLLWPPLPNLSQSSAGSIIFSSCNQRCVEDWKLMRSYPNCCGPAWRLNSIVRFKFKVTRNLNWRPCPELLRKSGLSPTTKRLLRSIMCWLWYLWVPATSDDRGKYFAPLCFASGCFVYDPGSYFLKLKFNSCLTMSNMTLSHASAQQLSDSLSKLCKS